MDIIGIVKDCNLNLLKDNLKFSNINIIDFDGSSLLAIAVKNNSLSIVNFLLQNGINPDTIDENGDSPLHLSIKKQYLAITKSILRNKANTNILNALGETPFMLALRYQRHFEVKLLLEFNPLLNIKNIYGEGLAFYLVYNNDINLFNELKITDAALKETNQNMDSLLHLASTLGFYEVASFLISRGLMVNSRNKIGETPLFNCAKKSNFRMASLLLDNMALVDFRNIFDESVYDYSSSVMIDYIKLKISNPNYQKYMTSYPLHIAAIKDDYNMAVYYNSIINRNKKDDFGYHAVDYANALNHLRIAELLHKNNKYSR